MRKRYLTLNCVIRKYQIETTRADHQGTDETQFHSAETVQQLADLIRHGMPDARITWAISWCALFDETDRYRAIRAKVRELHESYGDDVTFIPGGYFANRYNTRAQVNQDITDAFQRIAEWIGQRPKSLVAGFLSSENIRHAREQEGVIGVQGNIWSQFSVDNQDGDGSIAYPYYPSTQHFCKPAQGPGDFIDCVNFDGWTVDFFNARLVGCRTHKRNSRLGVGPIETLRNFGGKKGLVEMQATTSAHFEQSAPFNPFTWVTNCIEVSLLHGIPDIGYLTRWLQRIRDQWPDAVCPTLAGLAADFRAAFPDNTRLAYELHQQGDGIGAARQGHDITWYMNQAFRCGIEKDRRGRAKIFDYTRYTVNYQEPTEVGTRNWSILDKINQKQTRKQDRPVDVRSSSDWLEITKKLREKQNLKNFS